MRFSKESSVSPSGQAGLNAFVGVFTPTLLTILGVIMYLRFGWVVGEVGLNKALVVVLLANAITLLTALSLSAVATNSKVGVGGAYYIISRSLGLEIGGAIGLPLYLSQALSVTLYSFGLAESLRIVCPSLPVAPAAFMIIIFVAILSFRGASFALRSQIPIMMLIGVSIAALWLGTAFREPVRETLASVATSPREGFWEVFAVFFPAVTGVMAGLSLSGDLSDPRKAIPRGALWATTVGLLVYLFVPVVLNKGATTEALRGEPLIWTRIALGGPWLVLPGLWGAIFSSAVGSMLGAPRTLQALAMDRLAPGKLAGAVKGREPRAGMMLTLAISLTAVFLGDLNRVATVVTMFFLSVYGTINMVAALEKLSGNPSWRPTLDVPWPLSLAGAAGCVSVMLLIHWPATLIAVSIEVALWLGLQKKNRGGEWGDVRRDLYEALVRWALIHLSAHPMTARNWRPHILVFVGSVERRVDLVQYASWFSEGRGVVTVCELEEGDLLSWDMGVVYRERQIDRFLKEEGIPAFGEVNVVGDVERGILAVTQANGLAGMESNTVMVGWPDDLDRLTTFLRLIRRLKQLHCSLIIGKLTGEKQGTGKSFSKIQVWWGGLRRNGDLMLLLSYLLTRNAEWGDARIEIKSIASNALMKSQTERFLGQLMPEIRIQAKVDVMVKPEDETVFEILRRESKKADLVLLGLASPEEGGEEAYARRLVKMTEGLPPCFLLHNGSLFIGDLVTSDALAQGQEVPSS